MPISSLIGTVDSFCVAIGLAGVSASGTSAVGMSGIISVVQTGSAPTPITVETLIPLGLFFAGLAITSTIVWKAAAHKTKSDQQISNLSKRVEELERKAR